MDSVLSSPAAVAVHARRGYVYSTYFVMLFFTFWLFGGLDVFILVGTFALEFMVRVRTWHRLVLVVVWFLTPWTTSSSGSSRSLRWYLVVFVLTVLWWTRRPQAVLLGGRPFQRLAFTPAYVS